MEVCDLIISFLIENLNIVMILLGFFVLCVLFLLLYLDSRHNKTYDFKKRQNAKIEQELINQELFEETTGAINLCAKDLNFEEVAEINSLIDNIEITSTGQSISASQDFDLNADTEEQEQKITSKKAKKECLAKIEDTEESALENANEKIEGNLESTQIAEETEINTDSVLSNYEHVIKESDAMLEVMQNIIDENIVEMENLEKQNLDSTEEVCQKDKASIVSKYRVLYDKTKKEWIVKKDGSTRATKRCKSRDEAIAYAKQCTINSDLGTTFHKKDGKFQKKANKID